MAAPRRGTRKFDKERPLKVCRLDSLNDLRPEDLPNKLVELQGTGVEKEEEEESHLQNVFKGLSSSIPTRDASQRISSSDYESLYPPSFKLPKTLCKLVTTTIEEMVTCAYDMDDADEVFLKSLNDKIASEVKRGKKATPENRISEDAFEHLMNMYEDRTNSQGGDPILWQTIEPQIMVVEKEKLSDLAKKFAKDIHTHWESKRRAKGKPLTPMLKMVDESAKAENYDPYVCFRKRETRAGRRTRRMDNIYVEKLRKLRTELNDAKVLLDVTIKRDKFKREILNTELDLFEATMRSRNLKRMLEECGVDIHSPSPVKSKPVTKKPSKITISDPSRGLLTSRASPSPTTIFLPTSRIPSAAPNTSAGSIADRSLSRRPSLIDDPHGASISSTVPPLGSPQAPHLPLPVEIPFNFRPTLPTVKRSIDESNQFSDYSESPFIPLPPRPFRSHLRSRPSPSTGGSRMPYGGWRVGRGRRMIFDRAFPPRRGRSNTSSFPSHPQIKSHPLDWVSEVHPEVRFDDDYDENYEEELTYGSEDPLMIQMRMAKLSMLTMEDFQEIRVYPHLAIQRSASHLAATAMGGTSRGAGGGAGGSIGNVTSTANTSSSQSQNSNPTLGTPGSAKKIKRRNSSGTVPGGSAASLPPPAPTPGAPQSVPGTPSGFQSKQAASTGASTSQSNPHGNQANVGSAGAPGSGSGSGKPPLKKAKTVKTETPSSVASGPVTSGGSNSAPPVSMTSPPSVGAPPSQPTSGPGTPQIGLSNAFLALGNANSTSGVGVNILGTPGTPTPSAAAANLAVAQQQFNNAFMQNNVNKILQTAQFNPEVNKQLEALRRNAAAGNNHGLSSLLNLRNALQGNNAGAANLLAGNLANLSAGLRNTSVSSSTSPLSTTTNVSQGAVNSNVLMTGGAPNGAGAAPDSNLLAKYQILGLYRQGFTHDNPPPQVTPEKWKHYLTRFGVQPGTNPQSLNLPPLSISQLQMGASTVAAGANSTAASQGGG